MRIGRIARSCTCVLVVAGLGGCGTTTSATSTATATGGKLAVYATVPSGSEGQDIFDAEQLALTQGGKNVGKYTIELRQTKLPADTTKAITADARQAVDDPSTIAYLAEVVPGTSDASVPITNQLGILQLSPTDNAVELTQGAQSSPSRARRCSTRRSRPTATRSPASYRAERGRRARSSPSCRRCISQSCT